MNKRGFGLPAIIMLTTMVLIIMASVILATNTMYHDSHEEYYQRSAETAAEAGLSLATGCLITNNHQQSWPSSKTLRPDADCVGNTVSSKSKYVYESSGLRTTFVVGDLEYALDHSVQISAKGTAERLGPSGNVIKQYTSILKKSITWKRDLTSESSASGTFRTCAVMSGNVYCWGKNRLGQLGNGKYTGPQPGFPMESFDPETDSRVPVAVLREPGGLLGKKVKKLFAAQYHTCALTTDHEMYCWGYNYRGQLGDGTTNPSPRPIRVGGPLLGKTITDIGGTLDTSCAIADGKIYCWGDNVAGVTGTGSSQYRLPTPQQVGASGTADTLHPSYTALSLSTSGSRSQLMCAVINNGIVGEKNKAYCWGRNAIGSVGNGTVNHSLVIPHKVYDGGVLKNKKVTTITQDGFSNTVDGFPHVCALADGKVYCWGWGKAGQVGDGTKNNRTTPVSVAEPLKSQEVVDVKAGIAHTCALTSAGAVYCWGINGNGQLGLGYKSSGGESIPKQVYSSPDALDGTNAIAIGAGSNRGCAVVKSGLSYCWGRNTEGQIGDGTLIDRAFPTEAYFLRPFNNQYIY